MATVLHSESRRLYSWWWDSHIPKNSKWIQQNLSDMDSKVKAMIKLIEEDADSFARRAEMYYKKRPELMKLVEEFYRAYRALAERYDHATVELCHAHKTMAEAFPNQVPFDMIEDSASSSCSEPRTPEKMPPGIQPFYDSDSATSKRGLSQLTEYLGNSETEVESLKRTLVELGAEKEALNLQYQLSLNKFSRLEKDLEVAQKDVSGLDERASKAEIETKILAEALAKLEAERDAALLRYNESMQKITELEESFSHAQEDVKGLTNRATKAETEVENLKQAHSRLHSEKEAGLAEYNRCLEMISNLEKKVRDAEENAQNFSNQSAKAEDEIKALRHELVKVNEVKDGLRLRFLINGVIITIIMSSDDTIEESLLVDPKLLFIGSKIGEGAHGKVYQGRYGRQIVAIKVVNRGSKPDQQSSLESRFVREVNMMSRVQHHNLVKFIGACKDPLMVIVTELLPGMSLRKYLTSIRPQLLHLPLALSFALDIARALHCLHANGIIHRDLKPDNLLLTENHKSVKLADFGLAREESVTEMMTAETGTYRWMAPELYSTVTLRQGEKKHYNNKVDVYSFGIVLWELLTNRMPFEGMSNLQAAYAAAFKQERPVMPEGISPSLAFIVQSCWVEDPNMRPSFSQIIRLLNEFLLTLTPPPPQPLPETATNRTNGRAITEFSIRPKGKFAFIRQLFAAKRNINS